jgi:hypothetical protein
MRGRFKLINRSWAGGFLFYDMEKLPESGAA